MSAKGENIFVAPWSSRYHPDGRPLSYAIWAADEDHTLLPKTDLIAFFAQSGGELPRLVEWEKVVEVAGDLMEAVDIYPPRYRVRAFPTKNQLTAMGNMLS